METSFDAIAVIDAGADHFQEAVLGAVGVAGASIESVGEDLGEFNMPVERVDGMQSGIAGGLARRWLDYEWRAEEG